MGQEVTLKAKVDTLLKRVVVLEQDKTFLRGPISRMQGATPTPGGASASRSQCIFPAFIAWHFNHTA